MDHIPGPRNDMVKIIGIDPGLASTGVGVLQGTRLDVKGYAYGTIQTPKTKPLPWRLHHIYTKISQVLEKESPHLMVVEDVFSLQQYPKSGITLGQVTGVILLAGAMTDVPVKQIPVREAKRALTGNGNATKSQLEKAIREYLKIDAPIKPDHASDALGLALLGLFRYCDNGQLGAKGSYPGNAEKCGP
jgi:crossover junction endodeoxyribonuclease RuvC